MSAARFASAAVNSRIASIAVLRFEADAALRDALSDADLARLIAEAEGMARAGGVDPASIRAADLSSMATSGGIEASEHGRPPMATLRECGCGPCSRWRRDRSES